MGYIDCDSHVIETDETWSYLSKNEMRYRPTRVALPANDAGAVIGAAAPAMNIWLVGDTWCSALPNHSNLRNNANIFYEGATDLTDPQARIEDLDSLAIDAQLLLSSFYISIELDNPVAEATLARSYNRWLADRLGELKDAARLPWAVRPPLRSIPDAIRELEFGAEHGAVGMQLRGVEHGTFLSDPSFTPVFDCANELGLVAIVHIGAALRRIDNQMLGRTIFTPEVMTRQLYDVLAGFETLISSDFGIRFPNLRWVFVEAGATWAPAVVQMDARLRASAGRFLDLHPITPSELEDKNIFITCEADEDLAYLTSVLGENVLVTGTDYGHNDLGSELGAHTSIVRRTDIAPSVAEKIVHGNARRLLNLAADFQPAPMLVSGKMPHVRGCTDDAIPIIFPPNGKVQVVRSHLSV